MGQRTSNEARCDLPCESGVRGPAGFERTGSLVRGDLEA